MRAATLTNTIQGFIARFLLYFRLQPDGLGATA
jgi:hypothetical protein